MAPGRLMRTPSLEIRALRLEGGSSGSPRRYVMERPRQSSDSFRPDILSFPQCPSAPCIQWAKTRKAKREGQAPLQSSTEGYEVRSGAAGDKGVGGLLTWPSDEAAGVRNRCILSP